MLHKCEARAARRMVHPNCRGKAELVKYGEVLMRMLGRCPGLSEEERLQLYLAVALIIDKIVPGTGPSCHHPSC